MRHKYALAIIGLAATGVFCVAMGLGRNRLEPKHSFSNPQQMVVEKTALDLIIDFDRKVVRGKASLSIKRLNGTELWLDTSLLHIKSITGDLQSFDKIVDPDISKEGFGEPLVIKTKDQDTLNITIEYESDRAAPGLVWLDGDATRSKEPFMFAMNEPIGARSWFPCQDTPAVRGIYTANLKIVAHGRDSKEPLMALISGENNPRTSNAAMTYDNLKSTLVPIPSYLFVIAAGRFLYGQQDDTIGFYADSQTALNDALLDLKEAPKYFAELKRLLGDNLWPKQDFLFLPPIDGFGGMENPMLIYVNEGLADKRFVLAHELAHMWTGNLVISRQWDSFWINEAWSTYYEDRVLEAVHGKAFSDANAKNTLRDLVDAEKIRLAHVGSEPSSQPTRMQKVNAERTHPNQLIDFSVYSKGASMLHNIEKIIGRKSFDIYAKAYLAKFLFIPITSEIFVNFSAEILDSFHPPVDWKLYLNDWIFSPGISPTTVPLDNGLSRPL